MSHRRRRTRLSISGTFSSRSRNGSIRTSLSRRGRGSSANIRLSAFSSGGRRSRGRATLNLRARNNRGSLGGGISFGF